MWRNDREPTRSDRAPAVVSHTTETESTGRRLGGEGDDHPLLTVVHHPSEELVAVTQVVPPGEHVVGRDVGQLLPGVFDLPKISRQHATFVLARGQLGVRDLDSRNGTHVNGDEVTQATLSAGDVVRIGDVVLLHHRGPRSHERPEHPLFAGSGHALARLLEDLRAAATTGQNVMLVGESGTGKELAAQVIHEESGRSGAFVPVNCGGIAEGVLQSELFGHARGAFSGADAGRRGLLEEARGGTLFLDEVGAASPTFQATLLRLLENSEYRVVGTNTLRRADVRFVAATQPDVEEKVDQGTFRRDLWYRLAYRLVRVPALRERREDIPAIIARHSRGSHQRPLRVSSKLAALLIRHDWPGNVRELLSTIDHLASSAGKSEELDVPDWLKREIGRRHLPPSQAGPKKRPEKGELIELLTEHRGSVAATAKAVGVDRKTLYRWLTALGIDLEDLRSGLD